MKYSLSFKIVPDEAEAVRLCERLNRSATAHMRKHHPAEYTPWNTEPGKFVVWFYC